MKSRICCALHCFLDPAIFGFATKYWGVRKEVTPNSNRTSTKKKTNPNYSPSPCKLQLRSKPPKTTVPLQTNSYLHTNNYHCPKKTTYVQNFINCENGEWWLKGCLNLITIHAPAQNTRWVWLWRLWWKVIFFHNLRIGLFQEPITHVSISLYIARLPGMVHLNVPGILIRMFMSLFAEMVKFGNQVNIYYLF